MDRELRLVWLYCVIEDAVRQSPGEARLRSRGPTPALTDVEAFTIEIFGETLGLNSDASIWRYACAHLRDWFPGLGTEWNFVRRCANLSWLKARLQDALFHPSGDWNAFDGLPLPVCKYARSRRDKRFRGEAAWSVCAAKQEKYYGFKAGVLMNSAGEIFRWWLSPANTDEREMLDASAIPVRRQGADLRRLDRPVGRARCRFDDAAAGKHDGRPSAVADPAGDAPAAGDRDGFQPPRRGLRRLAEQGPGLLEVVGPVPSQSPRLQPLTPVRAHLRQEMTSSSDAGNPRFGYQDAKTVKSSRLYKIRH